MTSRNGSNGSGGTILGKPAPVRLDQPDGDAELEGLLRRLLVLLGEEPGRAGLVETPSRVAEALRWLTQGYTRSATDAVGRGIFEEQHESMVLVRDIELYSLCEHHMLLARPRLLYQSLWESRGE